MADDKLTIRQALSLPPKDALEAFARRDELKVSVNWRDLQPEEHARAFTVAKIARTELLVTVRDSLNKALAEGHSFAMWQKAIVPELQKAGWWGMVQNRELTGTDDAVFVGEKRLRTIFRTNMRVSHAAGQWERFRQVKAFRPYLRYSAVMDSRTRPQHARWHGIILPVEHPFWQTHFPPNGWNCRCAVIGLSERDLERRGWKVTTEEELARLVPMDPVGRMPFGPPGQRRDRPRLPAIDPGWDYNVGAESTLGLVEKAARVILQARAVGLDNRADELLEQLKTVLAEDMLELLLRLIDGIEPASWQWEAEVAAARKRKRRAAEGPDEGGGASAVTRAKLSRIAQLRKRIGGRFADELQTQREAARLAHTRQWVADTVKPGAVAAEPLDLGQVSPRTAAQMEGFGVQLHSRAVMLEHGHTRHMFRKHGGASEANRGQVALTADDAHALPRILDSWDEVKHLATFPGQHRSSPQRFDILSTVDGHRYQLLVEIQQKGIVPRTMWKFPVR